MTANPSNIFAGLSGSPTPNELMWIADAASAVLPTDSTTALDASFESVGLVTTDGATTSTAISANDVQSFGTYSPSRTIVSQEVISVAFTAQETNKITAAIKARRVRGRSSEGSIMGSGVQDNHKGTESRRERAKLAKSAGESTKLILGLRPPGETNLIFLLCGSVSLW